MLGVGMGPGDLLAAMAILNAVVVTISLLATIITAVMAVRISRDTRAIRESAQRAADSALQVQHQLSQGR